MCGEIKDILRPRTPHAKPPTSETGARSKTTVVAQTATEREISEIVSQMTLKAEQEDVLLPVTSTVPDDEECEPVHHSRADENHSSNVNVTNVENVVPETEVRQRRPEDSLPPAVVRRPPDPEPEIPLRLVIVNSGPIPLDYVRPFFYYLTIALISIAMLLLLCFRAAKQAVPSP